MVIAVIVVSMVQPPINKMINVIAVRHVLMLAVLVVAATVDSSTGRWIRIVHSQYVFVVMVVVSRMEMPIVQVVVMVPMRNAQVAARIAMDMGMTGVGFMTWHFFPPYS
jgi:hypothetical protein